MQSHQPNPAELLALIRSGDHRALDTLYRAWSPKVRLFARMQLAPSGLDAEAMADEVTVDVFHDLWRYPERYDGRVTFSTWLLTLARNKAISLLRRALRHPEPIDTDGFDPPADPQYEPPAQLAKQQRQHGVMDCLRRLRNPLQRESLMLWAMEDMPLAQIAQLQNSPENTVKTRLYHGRLNLRACLQRWLAREGDTDAR